MWTQTLRRLRQLKRQKCSTLILATVLLLSFAGIVIVLIVLFFQSKLLGDGPTLQGGSVGRRIDNTHKRWLFDHYRDSEYRRDFERTLGYPVPVCPESTANAFGVPVLLSTFYTETLRETQTRQSKQNKCHETCPRCLFRPLVGNWYQSSPFEDQWTEISFVESEIDLWMIQHFSSSSSRHIWELYQSFSIVDRVQFWGLAMLWEYGGMFLLLDVHMTNQDMAKLPIRSVAESKSDKMLSWSRPSLNSSVVTVRATESHTRELSCLFDSDAAWSVHDLPSFAHVMAFLKQVESCGKEKSAAEVMDSTCCSIDKAAIRAQMTALEPRDPTSVDIDPQYHVIVEEVNAEREMENHRVPKLSHAAQMKQKNCTPGWFCNRCLRMPWRGTLARCKTFCHDCYLEQITSNTDTVLDPVEIRVHVQAKRPNREHTRRRIPRIIHQTWFEELTVENYPHLTRLQNSWKVSGWEYRFYTDESGREYIIDNFPDRFVQAYDAILPGAFKADFFRLLVLLKDGGVYADIDVQLETNLDSLIPAHLSFFVPRDVPIDRWPHSNYCLWNGLMGAAPGHAIIAQAVQDLLQKIENRWDYYDVENDLCRESMDCEIWKLRSIPVLILTGPCALGISVHKALGHTNKVQGFELGWLSSNSTHEEGEGVSLSNENMNGDGLIFLTDRYDLGELRFSDVKRGLMVASTNQDKFLSSPIKTTRRASATHYSKSETDIMGTSGTYVDNLVSNQLIKVIVRHEEA